MITSTANRFLMSLLAISLVIVTPSAHAVNCKSRMLWLGVGIIALNIYWKIKQPALPDGDESLLRSLRKATSINEFCDIFERWVLGHCGKSASIKLSADNRTKFAHELVVTMDKGIPAYGLCGVTWSYVKHIYESLKAVKDLSEMTKFFEITD